MADVYLRLILRYEMKVRCYCFQDNLINQSRYRNTNKLITTFVPITQDFTGRRVSVASLYRSTPIIRV